MTTHRTHPHALALLNGRATRKLANNTYARKLDNGGVAVKLHATDVLTFNPDGSVTVTTGGYKTPTTKDRINGFLPHGFPRVYQAKGVWQWAAPYREGQPFQRAALSTYQDGDTLGRKGALRPSPGKAAEAARVKALVKRINAFAEVCAAAVPMPAPSGGDCWLCLLERQGHDQGTGHLDEHMRDGYAVPSLVLTALEATGNGDAIKAAAFGQYPAYVGLAKDRVRKAVRRHLKARFGLAGGAFRKDPAQTGFAVR